MQRPARDFFGPLCVAGVYVNETVIKAWTDAGIRDSKNISSDKKIKELTQALELARLKIEGLETMIKVAEEDLQIKIRKKAGTKQSKE